MGELALKTPVQKEEPETKGNKDDSEDGQQNPPCSLNIVPTNVYLSTCWEVSDYWQKEWVTSSAQPRPKAGAKRRP
jgi:hypothetical protein